MDFDELTQEIREKIDIVELISEYIELKKAGQNLKGLCPFHSEKTPSFMVSPTKQIFHCFGCNKGGDIFTFLMNYENITFSDALSLLAQRAGIQIKAATPDFKKSIKEKLYAINNEAKNFYVTHLKNSQGAHKYLKDRAIQDDFIEKFSIGFIGNEKDSLFNHLKTQGFAEQDIKASGLAIFYNGQYHDFFKSRIIFPIFDIMGRCIAFGGRTISSSKDIPKYINSTETLIFKKGQNCFGLNIAKSSIKQKGYSIIVEGYFDTIICHQFGLDNTIAPLGTALTNDQLRRIKRFSDKILLLFDGDSAGISAGKRSLEIIFSEAMIAKVLLLPEGEDPDTFLRKYGIENLKRHMSQAKKPVEFILSLFSKNKLAGVRYILNMLSTCPDQLLRDSTISNLSNISKLNELTLRQELKGILQKATNQKINKKEHKVLQKVTSLIDNLNKDEKMLLKIALTSPENCLKVLNHIDYRKIESVLIRSIFEKIDSLLNIQQTLNLEDLIRLCSIDEQNLLTELSVDSNRDIGQLDIIIDSFTKAIELKDLEKKIAQATENNDISLLHELFIEKNRLLSQKGGQ